MQYFGGKNRTGKEIACFINDTVEEWLIVHSSLIDKKLVRKEVKQLSLF